MAKDTQVIYDDFGVCVTGGEWLGDKKSKAFDNIMGIARGTAYKEFCERHHEQYSFRASYVAYGAKTAAVLCRSWCHRAQYFYGQERRGPFGQGVVLKCTCPE